MKKLFIDTNIVIDLLSAREPFYEETALLFSLADRRIVEMSISSLSIANTHYILKQQIGSEKAQSTLRKLIQIVNTLPLDEKIIALALNDDTFTDFEDAIQYFTAIVSNQDLIVTRNLKDYKHSKLPVMTAKQFLGSSGYKT